MDFDPSEEQSIALDAFRRFVEAEIAPAVSPWRDATIPKDLVHSLLRKLGPHGVGTGWLGEGDGGLALDLVTSGLLYEELARVSPGLAGTAFINEGVALAIATLGNPEQKKRWLPGLLCGELIGCSAITEPGVGSNVRDVRTRAVRDGDGWRVRGEKTWISNAGISDLAVVVVRGEDASEGLSQMVVERGDGYRSRELAKLGLNDWSTAELVFDDVYVPGGRRLGEPGAGLRSTLRLFERELAQLPRFPTIRAENARQTYFTREELDGLVKALPEELAEGGRGDLGNEWLVPFVITAFWTGARLRELLHLERRRLDLEAGKITLPPGSTKNRKGRTFYLPPPALAALRAWDANTRALEKERGIIVRMAFHRYGKQISNEFPYGIFHGACVRAGIVGRRKIHDFRRSAARNYRASGVSEGVVMAICGWRTRAMFDRYDIKNEDDLRKAAAQVVISDEVVARSGGEAEIISISQK